MENLTFSAYLLITLCACLCALIYFSRKLAASQKFDNHIYFKISLLDSMNKICNNLEFLLEKYKEAFKKNDFDSCEKILKRIEVKKSQFYRLNSLQKEYANLYDEEWNKFLSEGFFKTVFRKTKCTTERVKELEEKHLCK